MFAPWRWAVLVVAWLPGAGWAADADFAPLFPKDSFDGWQFSHWSDIKAPPKAEGPYWKIENGVLEGLGKSTWLYSTADYGDFTLRFEAKLAKGANSGIGLRFPPAGDPAYRGMEVQLVDAEIYYHTGNWNGYRPEQQTASIYDELGPTKNVVKPAGEWNRFEIACRGSRVTIVLNGERVLDADLARETKARQKKGPALADRPRYGRIGFQNLSGKVWLRNVQVQRLGPPRPNVLVILTDDQRWDAMSCAGHPFLKTPNIDRLAAEGARFANAFVTTSLCSPSRASLLSGRYAHSHGVLNNFTDYPHDLPGYPRRLQESGYETAYIGKWHMGEDDDRQRPGFDHWMSHKGQGNYFDNEFNINGERRTIKGYYTEVVTDQAVEWLKRPHDRPFLLVLGHKAPHGGPIVPEPKFERAFDALAVAKPPTAGDFGPGKPDWLRLRVDTWHGINGPLYGLKEFDKFIRYYHATLLSVEESVGRILKTLEATGRLDDTIIVFTSDNGFFLGEHGCVDKRAMYEESIRVPLLVRYPRQIKPAVVEKMVLNVDLAPSLLDLCGASPLEKIHGRSWRPLLAGQGEGWRTAWHYAYNYETQFPYTPNVRGVRTDEWKYIHYPHGDGTPDRHRAELYCLKADPRETRNLIDDPALSGKLAELRAELARLLKQTGADPDPMPLDQGIKNVLPKY